VTRQAGKETVHKLIKDFENNESQYMSKDFQETETRNRFIDPFFTALGWELNQTELARKFWDVHREYSQRDNSTTKKPDYAFRVKEKEGVKYREKFFVEAKAPHVDLKSNDPVYQAKRYAFSSHGKTPIVVLTDFQTFRVFNGLEKPVFENPLQGLIKDIDLEYSMYLDTWDLIWDAFSKEAVTEGSIEQLVGKVGRNTKSLDDEFLADISEWRETLAKNVAIRNKDLLTDHINEAVQRILDRLIFIRNLEDREIEKENMLLSILNVKENIYSHLLPLFRSLDIEYNGLLFKEHFSETKNVDDPTIKIIIKQLCPPHSPYQFDMIEPEILGRIYERFLGSKIRLTENHQAKVEEKPEVKKAGGVYYTPQYIVDYIVENTVGVKIKDKTPEEIAEIKICDPACGSGSFLLGAFQYLLEYHREWYAKANQTTQKKYKNDFFTTAENEIQLTLKKKTEILKNNIFGVDIDREATEVAVMSLYLKILDEGYEKGQAELFMRGHILPDMTGNIKCGNSLIGTDYSLQGELIQTEELKKVNCFDWADEFKHLLNKEDLTTNHTNQHEQKDTGLFDIVIGNPPYVLVFDELIKKYIENNFIEFQRNNDLYTAFIIKGMRLLKETGIFSFITPNTYLKGDYFKELRLYLKKYRIIEILDFGIKQVFKDATVFTAICNISKEKPANQWILKSDIGVKKGIINYDENVFVFTNTLIKKLDSYKKFNDFFLIKDVGYNYWSIGRGKIRGDSIGSRILYSGDKQNNTDIPYYKGSNIQKYILNTPSQYLRYDYAKYLKKNDVFRFTPELLETKPKIIYRQTSSSLIAAIDNNGYHNDKTVHIILPKDTLNDNIDLKYVLALFNSKLLNYFYQFMTEEKGRAFAQVKTINVKNLPFILPDKTKHDALVSLVDKMLDLKQKEAAEVSDHLKTVITRQIDAIDKAIDTAVYELYNLTAEEIKIVES